MQTTVRIGIDSLTLPLTFTLPVVACWGRLIMTRTTRLLMWASLFMLLTINGWAQGIFATLTGIVSDPSGAVISGAKITLRDTVSGSLRDTVYQFRWVLHICLRPRRRLRVDRGGCRISSLQGRQYSPRRRRAPQCERNPHRGHGHPDGRSQRRDQLSRGPGLGRKVIYA